MLHIASYVNIMANSSNNSNYNNNISPVFFIQSAQRPWAKPTLTTENFPDTFGGFKKKEEKTVET